MPAPKVLIFATADQTGEAHRRLEAAGCELTVGSAGWLNPQGVSGAEPIRKAQDCDALAGTMIRSTQVASANKPDDLIGEGFDHGR